ncbi:MAG: hypothetical protein KAJ37_06115, partial [Candidatus Krumholzibacteria bacterium]|nr:hypothetical protein [Candidatus Krumholzibacteria bacterium]
MTHEPPTMSIVCSGTIVSSLDEDGDHNSSAPESSPQKGGIIRGYGRCVRVVIALCTTCSDLEHPGDDGCEYQRDNRHQFDQYVHRRT